MNPSQLAVFARAARQSYLPKFDMLNLYLEHAKHSDCGRIARIYDLIRQRHNFMGLNLHCNPYLTWSE